MGFIFLFWIPLISSLSIFNPLNNSYMQPKLRRYELLNANGEIIRTIVAPSKESCSKKIEAFYGNSAPFVKIGKSKPFTLPE